MKPDQIIAMIERVEKALHYVGRGALSLNMDREGAEAARRLLAEFKAAARIEPPAEPAPAPAPEGGAA